MPEPTFCGNVDRLIQLENEHLDETFFAHKIGDREVQDFPFEHDGLYARLDITFAALGCLKFADGGT